jgi:hypothetical protein
MQAPARVRGGAAPAAPPAQRDAARTPLLRRAGLAARSRPARVRAAAAEGAGSTPAAPSGGAERYAARGVSASKEDVHAAIASLDKGLYPSAFCKARRAQ